MQDPIANPAAPNGRVPATEPPTGQRLAPGAQRSECSLGAAGAGGMPVSDLPWVRSDALLQGGRELTIQHGDAVYRLRLTAQDKLILTK